MMKLEGYVAGMDAKRNAYKVLMENKKGIDY
jgi:hypothetical protein